MAEITVLHYQTAAKRVPYQEWFDSLTDKLVKAALLARVNRLRLGYETRTKARTGGRSP